MQKLILTTLSMSALSAVLVAQAPPGDIVAGALDASLGPAEIQAGAPTKIVQELGQNELRPIAGQPGKYRYIATYWDGGQWELISGIYDYAGMPGQNPSARFVDDTAVDLLNGAGDEFQGSMSHDGLLVVWDSDVGNPNLGGQPSINVAYLCSRPSALVNPPGHPTAPGIAVAPFQNGDAVPIQGVPAGYVDPHLVGPDSQGNYELYIADANGDIGRFSLALAFGDPANPWKVTAATATYIAPGKANINSNPGGRLPSFLHSPFVQVDSSGKPRSLNFSDGTDTNNNTNFVSNGYWTGAVDDSEPIHLMADTATVTLPMNAPDWFANPSVNGGTMAWALADNTGFYIDPWVRQTNYVVKADFTQGDLLAAYAPIAPTAPGPQYLSAIGFGPLAPAPVPIPPVQGNVVIFPLVVSNTIFHDTQTGRGELNFGTVSGFGTFQMQIVTLSIPTLTVVAGSTATANM